MKKKEINNILRIVHSNMSGKYKFEDFKDAFIDYLINNRYIDSLVIRNVEYVEDYDLLYEAASSFWENVLKKRTW